MSNLASVSHEYHNMEVGLVNGFAATTKSSILKNPTVFLQSKITVNDAALEVLIDNDSVAYIAYKRGGIDQFPAWDTARGLLMEGLDSNADFIDSVAKGDVNIIILSGYNHTSIQDIASIRPSQAQKLTLTAGTSLPSGEMEVECETFQGRGFTYGCIVSEGMPLAAGWLLNPQGQFVITSGTTNRIFHDVNNQRKKRFVGLTKGVEYYFYFYITNSAGVSVLSEVKSGICG